ncbi:MAG: 50S ribosomal protein L25/general stress protein Ctc [Burkholderiales bacterium]|nr:50S ribosomal protein L25/general stress protein Ctc [Burkholderiales bacterium]
MEVVATPRSLQGTGASRRLRNTGRTPAIIYGGGKPAVAVELDHNSLSHQLKLEAFHASILNLKLGNDSEQVLLRDVQMHPWKPMVLHVDFQRVAANEKLHAKVPLHFVNAEIAPGVKLGHGIINHVLNELEVSCLPKDLPEFITVDLAELQLGHSVHLADLKLPDGVESVQQKKGENLVVATIQVPAGSVEAEADAAATPAAAVPATAQKDKDEKK